MADFLCQTREMATNKSKSLYWLSNHVFVYSTVTALGWLLLLGLPVYDGDKEIVFTFTGLTFITHWITDAITSRLTTYFYNKKEYFWFFGVIGLDQFIHAVTLLLTYKYFFV